MLYLSNEFKEIMDHLGEELPRPYGPHVLLKLYVPEEMARKSDGSESGILLPESVREDAIYSQIVGLVLAIGPACYQEERFKYWERCFLGQWVIFRPNEGTRFSCKGVPLRYVYEDRLLSSVKDPSKISRD